MDPITVIIWTCVAVFILTAIVAILHVTGTYTLPNPNHGEMLFKVLIVEIAIIAVTAFGGYLQRPTLETTPAVASTPAAMPAPVFEIQWKKVDSLGREYSQMFTHTSENRDNIGAINVSGTYRISNPNGKIYMVQFSHDGQFCGWNYNPAGGYSGNTNIVEGGRGFRWARRWDGRPCTESYEAFYELPEEVCISNCE